MYRKIPEAKDYLYQFKHLMSHKIVSFSQSYR